MNINFVPKMMLRRIEHVDTDASGVMHFSRHTSLMETAFLELLEQHGIGLIELNKHNIDLRVTNLQIKFNAPAIFHDLVTHQVYIQHLGAVFVRVKVYLYRYNTEKEEEMISEGLIDLTCVDATKGKPVQIPLSIFQLLGGMKNG